MLGSWTRINGAGLTCPDWPLCHGRLLPSLQTERFGNGCTACSPFRSPRCFSHSLSSRGAQRRKSPFVTGLTGAIALLFCVQVLLGAATVRLSNTPLSVVLHWATAMALIAAISAMVIFAATSGCTVEALAPVLATNVHTAYRTGNNRGQRVRNDVHRRVRQLERRRSRVPFNSRLRRQRGRSTRRDSSRKCCIAPRRR